MFLLKVPDRALDEQPPGALYARAFEVEVLAQETRRALPPVAALPDEELLGLYGRMFDGSFQCNEQREIMHPPELLVTIVSEVSRRLGERILTLFPSEYADMSNATVGGIVMSEETRFGNMTIPPRICLHVSSISLKRLGGRDRGDGAFSKLLGYFEKYPLHIDKAHVPNEDGRCSIFLKINGIENVRRLFEITQPAETISSVAAEDAGACLSQGT